MGSIKYLCVLLSRLQTFLTVTFQLPHSVLALDKIPELKIPEEIGGQISSYKYVGSSTQPSKVQSVLKRRQDPPAWPGNIVRKE